MSGRPTDLIVGLGHGSSETPVIYEHTGGKRTYGCEQI